MKKPTVSLLISTYNWPKALLRCLESVLNQTHLPDEILIADDGSDSHTQSAIDNFSRNCSIPIRHFWQEDKGFRVAKIRNQAISNAKMEYIIHIDGDMLIHPKFIEDHLRICKSNTVIYGTRSLMNDALSQEILNSTSPLNLPIKDKRIEKIYNQQRIIPLLYAFYFFKRNNSNHKYALGCNLSFWKKDFVEVNGYNEDFEGWGKEEEDLVLRLTNNNIKLRSLKFGGIGYHLFHKSSQRDSFDKNVSLLQKSKKEKITYIENGIIKSKNKP
ncbi:MAG: glycosyltransferase family 2 protein [Pseudarcicella sp.]|nr:glycosyltransferase family 2 protein [Pseudarcicella sp.]